MINTKSVPDYAINRSPTTEQPSTSANCLLGQYQGEYYTMDDWLYDVDFPNHYQCNSPKSIPVEKKVGGMWFSYGFPQKPIFEIEKMFQQKVNGKCLLS